MVRLFQERILLIGDEDRRLETAVSQAAPEAAVRSVPTIFDGIAELSRYPFSTVMASAEPIERRPEAAVKTLRQMSGDGRLLLFGDPTLEPLSQKMLDFGCDDYLITPATAAEITKVLSTPPKDRSAETIPAESESPASQAPTAEPSSIETEPPARIEADPLSTVPVARILLDALNQQPAAAMAEAVRQINLRIMPGMELIVASEGTPLSPTTDNAVRLSHSIGNGSTLHLTLPRQHEARGFDFLKDLAALLATTFVLQERHRRLQRLAFTDDLTGIFNCRYFKHFLSRTLVEARRVRQPVTLLLFDIDNFKGYNDQFGHGVGDEILKQTAALMRRCVRDHDLVARISGDEFAVVFWEPEGPRMPREAQKTPNVPGRPPQEPQLILERFQKLLESQDFPELGSGGKGKLTISGGLAVFPYDAQDLQTLVAAADKALMFGAKRSGRNKIHLVGEV
jgi:two-component system cell cycle response regulator